MAAQYITVLKTAALMACLGGAYTIGQDHPPVPKPKPHIAHHVRHTPAHNEAALKPRPICPDVFSPVTIHPEDFTSIVPDVKPVTPPQDGPPGGSGVPEPISLALVLGGLGVLWSVRRGRA